MPRKKNRRKEIQKARRKAEAPAKPKPQRVAMIAHATANGAGMAYAVAAMLSRRKDQGDE